MNYERQVTEKHFTLAIRGKLQSHVLLVRRLLIDDEHRRYGKSNLIYIAVSYTLTEIFIEDMMKSQWSRSGMKVKRDAEGAGSPTKLHCTRPIRRLDRIKSALETNTCRRATTNLQTLCHGLPMGFATMKTVVTGFKQGTIYKIAPEKDAAFLVPMAEDDTTSCVQWSCQRPNYVI